MHLLAHVGPDGAGVWKVEFAGRTAGERIRNEGSFVRPPAVDRCFANAGARGDGFNGQFGKTVLSQKFQRAAQDGRVSLLAAWAPRSALAAAFTAFGVSPGLLAHNPTLPYNRNRPVESNTRSIESKFGFADSSSRLGSAASFFSFELWSGA
jgi:hypothetical protein